MINRSGAVLSDHIIYAKGADVMKGKKKRRLLFQITAIVLPLFLILSGAVTWLFYKSTINSFLAAQNERIEDSLNATYDNIIVSDDHDRILQDKWLISYLEENCDKDMSELTDEEWAEYNVMIDEQIQKWGDDLWRIEWLRSLSGKIKEYAARILYDSWAFSANIANNTDHYEKTFFMDTHGSYTGMIIHEIDGSGNSRKFGDRYDFVLSEHEALKEAIDSGSDEVVFELSENFPDEGNNYIAYRPVRLDGEVWAVLGVSYDWKDFKKSIDGNLRTAQILLISGILIIMAVQIFLLYRKVVRPVGRIQDALLDYTEDKDSKIIVKKMYDISEKNELGYLADVISDLALEIETYNKETARIAAEKERAQKELYEAEVQIMVSQIQPHFMYNALSSIAILCKLKPETAYEATINFSKYLRGNMDSLKQTEPVPFEVELDHLKKYLYIEKLRFADKLNVCYDIQTTDFSLPMLSIQPIVENAVKHGVGMKDDGGTVTIAAKETEDAYEVIISDDGVGFDMNAPKKQDGRSHIGMENTRKRLKDMCNADIIITSEIGKGTTARVIIPKNKEEEKQ